MKTRITALKDFVEGSLYLSEYSEPEHYLDEEGVEAIIFIDLAPYYGTVYGPGIQDGYLLNFYSVSRKIMRPIHSDHIEQENIMIYKI